MTITATVASAGPYSPNGITTAFSFAFAALTSGEVQVVRRSAAGVDTVLSGYAVTLNANQSTSPGGSVTFSVAPVAGDPIYVLSNPAFQQQITFANQGAWSPTSMNEALDRSAIRAIYLKNKVSTVEGLVVGYDARVTATINGAASAVIAATNLGPTTVSTVAAGLATTISGQIFRVTQANNLGHDYYLNNGGVAQWLNAQPATELTTARVTETSYPFPYTPVAAMISTHVLVQNERGANTAVDPTFKIFNRNLYGFPYSPRQQASGMAATLNFADGPVKTGTATRALSTGTTQSFILWNSTGPTTPPLAGTYTVAFQCKSNSGADAAIRYGNGTDGYTAGTALAASWTKFVLQITANGTNWASFIITGDGTNMPDLLIDEVQIYPDVSSALPSMATENPGNDFAFPFAFQPATKFSGRALDINGAGVPGAGVLRVSGYPTAKAFTELTMLTVSAMDVKAASQWLLSTDSSTPYGTSTATAYISSTQADGQMDHSIGSYYAAHDRGGAGFFIDALRIKAGAQEAFLDNIEMVSTTTAFAGFSARIFRVGAAANLATAWQNTTRWQGRIAAAVVFDRYLTDAEITSAVAALKARVRANGIIIEQIPAFYLAMGDSQTWHIDNSANQGPSYAYLQAVAGTYTPNLPMRNLAQSGNTFDQQLAFLPAARRSILAAVAGGRKAVVTMYIGSNPLGADVIAGGAAYWNRVKTEWADKITSSGGIPVVGTLTPRGDLDWETQRLAYNTALRASGVRYMDFAADATMGNAANYNLTGTTWVKSDGLHWTTVGQTLISAVATPVIKAALAS